jgi:hypothetical protein
MEPASAALIAQAQECIRGTFIELIGLRLLEVTSERAVAEVPVQVVKTEITPPRAIPSHRQEGETGLLHPAGRLHARR